jgi:hypothetical protein
MCTHFADNQVHDFNRGRLTRVLIQRQATNTNYVRWKTVNWDLLTASGSINCITNVRIENNPFFEQVTSLETASPLHLHLAIATRCCILPWVAIDYLHALASWIVMT